MAGGQDPIPAAQFLVQSMLLLWEAEQTVPDLSKAAERILWRARRWVERKQPERAAEILELLGRLAGRAAEREARLMRPQGWEALAGADLFYRRRARGEA